MTCFSLTSHWFFYSIDHSPDFSNVYLLAGTKYFVYSCGAKWRSLEFLKICPIFLDALKTVRILCLFNILPIFLPIFLWHMGEWIEFFRPVVSETIVLFACLLIVLIMSFLSCPFFLRPVLSGWVLSVDVLFCQRWWKLYVQVDCTLFLCWVVTRYISIYECWFFVHLMA